MQSRRKENIFISALMVLVLCGFLAFCEGKSYTKNNMQIAQDDDVTITMTANND